MAQTFLHEAGIHLIYISFIIYSNLTITHETIQLRDGCLAWCLADVPDFDTALYMTLQYYNHWYNTVPQSYERLEYTEAIDLKPHIMQLKCMKAVLIYFKCPLYKKGLILHNAQMCATCMIHYPCCSRLQYSHLWSNVGNTIFISMNFPKTYEQASYSTFICTKMLTKKVKKIISNSSSIISSTSTQPLHGKFVHVHF